MGTRLDAARQLVVAVETIQRNSTYFSSQTSQVILRPDLRGNRRAVGEETLTKREREVIQLLAEGKSTKEAAALLGLSVKTAETHRSNIMGKLGLHSVSELVLYAVRNGFVQASPEGTSSSPSEEGPRQLPILIPNETTSRKFPV